MKLDNFGPRDMLVRTAATLDPRILQLQMFKRKGLFDLLALDVKSFMKRINEIEVLMNLRYLLYKKN